MNAIYSYMENDEIINAMRASTSSLSLSSKGEKESSSAGSSHLEKDAKIKTETKREKTKEVNNLQAEVKDLNESDDQIKAERERMEVNEIIRQKIATNTLTDLSGNQIGSTRVMWAFLLLVDPIVND